MTQKIFWWLGVVVLIGLIGFIAYQGTNEPAESSNGAETTATSTAPAFDQTLSNGTFTIGFSSKDFGLATDASQVLARAYIPPCDPNFNYCLYYIGNTYAGTNFESAGLRIKKRTDLTSEKTCLTTPPAGYAASVKPVASTSTAMYASSVFTGVGGAGAGHYANGALYRLFVPSSGACYEFETRIGETQFANYPPGAIKEFTTEDRAAVSAELEQMIEHITLGGSRALFPAL
jgi:hypothetical protein